jgi:hypothetical protein
MSVDGHDNLAGAGGEVDGGGEDELVAADLGEGEMLPGDEEVEADVSRITGGGICERHA